MSLCHQTSRATNHRAFTLVEMIVVIIIIGIMASIILPRLVGNENRRFQLAVDEVSDLLMMYAQRESLGTKPVGFWEDAQKHRLVLMTLDIDERTPNDPALWIIDPTVRPVKLPDDVEVVAIHVDGEEVDLTEWPLQANPGESRPDLVVILSGPSGIITIALASHALSPLQIHSESYSQWLGGPIDLDAEGRDREDW